MFRLLLKNPILSISGVCLLLFLTAGIFFNGNFINVCTAHYIILSTLLIFCSNTSLNKIKMLALALVFYLCFMLFYEKDFLLLCGEIVLLTFVFLEKKHFVSAHLFFIIALSFLLHLFYIEQTLIDIRQHDLGGVIGYMMEITKNGFNFWNFNPWNMYYFFHQPLHFIIAGYLYLFQMSLWSSSILTQEGLQYLSLFYVTLSVLFATKIFYELNFRKYLLYSLVILFAFNPTLFLFSGFVSDDTPIFFWTILFLYQLIKWHKYQKTSSIVYAALCFGFGTLTKLSILTIVPAVTILFFYEFFTSDNKKKILYDLSIFTLVAVPLSLLWIARNHILFDMQFYNIPDTSPSGQNFKYLTFFDRIGDFSQFFSPFINAPQVADANMWLALIKTELFGEWNLSLLNSVAFIPAFLLYFMNITIKLLALYGSFIISYNFILNRRNILPLFFVLIYLILWGYSFNYSIKYPFVCSSDFRLFAALIVPELIILQTVFKNKGCYLMWGSFVYAALSAFIYVAIV